MSMLKRILSWLMAFCLLLGVSVSPALAYESTTLRNGSRGEEVRRLQQALISLGFLSGSADGIFGRQTEKAVRAFQKKNGLSADGLAGLKTQSALYSPGNPNTAPAPAAAAAEKKFSSSAPAAPLTMFLSDYTTIRPGDQGDRVVLLQEALIGLDYLSGRADGKFGNQTLAAVLDFQQAQKLSADGLAGRKTLKALEKAVAAGDKKKASEKTAVIVNSVTSEVLSQARIAAPDGGSIRLLHWYNDIKPSLKSKAILLIYDPATGLSWKLQVLSKGRHCDCEPLTLEDTQVMVHAFGDKNTWNQKGVYVQLPSGVWTIGSTHDMPHLSGSIADNGFDGHLCVHFFRDMTECLEKDPNYGVSNQKTIRELWYKLSGISIED